MKKILIGSLVGIVGLILIASLVLEFLNWNQFKPLITSEVEKATGRQLQIEGDLKVRLLPSPKLIVHKVKLSNMPGAHSPEMVKLERLKVGINLMPLLSKRLKITKIVLDTPVIHLEKIRGKGNWELSLKKEKTSSSDASSQTETSSQANKQDLQIGIDHAEIINGTVVYQEGKSVTRLDAINLTLQMETVQGPYELEGGFKYGDQPYEVELETGKPQGSILKEIDFKIQEKRGSLVFKGDADMDQLTAKGQLEAQLRLEKDIKIGGHVEASQKILKISQATLQYGETHGKGTVMVAFQPQIKVMADLKNLPGKTSLLLNAQAFSEGYKGTVSLKSTRLDQLGKAFNISAQSLTQASPSTITTAFQVSEDFKKVALSHLKMTLNKADCAGNITYRSLKKGFDVTTDLRTSNLKHLLQIGGVKFDHPIGGVQVQGRISGNLAKMSIDQKISALSGVVTIKGEISNPVANLSYGLQLAGQQLNISPLVQGGKKALPRLTFRTKAVGSASKIALSGLDLRLSDLHAHGNLAYHMGKRPKLTGSLTIPQGNLMHLIGGVEATTSKKGFASRAAPSPTSQSGKSSNQSRWSQNPLDLKAFKSVDVDLSIQSKDLSVGKLPLKQASLSLNLDQGKFSIKKTAKMAGGNLTVHMTGQISNTINATTKVKVENANLRILSESLADYKDLEGRVYLNLKTQTQGKSEYELVSNLSGQGDMRTEKSILKGWDFKKFGSSISSLQGLTRALTIDILMDRLKGKDKKTPFVLTGKTVITNGGANLDLDLNGQGIKGTGKGVVNLPRWYIDSKAEITLVELNNLLLPAHMKGPLDKPSYGIQSGKLMQYVYQNFLQNTVKETLKMGTDPLKAILGLGKNKQKTPQQGQPTPQKQTPSQQNNNPAKGVEKAIGNILNNIFR